MTTPDPTITARDAGVDSWQVGRGRPCHYLNRLLCTYFLFSRVAWPRMTEPRLTAAWLADRGGHTRGIHDPSVSMTAKPCAGGGHVRSSSPLALVDEVADFHFDHGVRDTVALVTVYEPVRAVAWLGWVQPRFGRGCVRRW
jgi:hypothetical protein